MLKFLFRADGLAAAALEGAVRAFSSRHMFHDRNVLDMGCGTMPYASIFNSCGARYVGADISGSPDLIIKADGSLPLADSSVHFVVSFQVLEHVRDVPAYLATIKRVLQPDGQMFLSTHGVWPYHPHPTDYWRWTRDGLRETVEQAGFTIVRMTPLCGPAAWIAMFPMLALKKLLGPGWVVLVPFILIVNVLAWAFDRLTPAGVRDENAAIYAVEAVRT